MARDLDARLAATRGVSRPPQLIGVVGRDRGGVQHRRRVAELAGRRFGGVQDDLHTGRGVGGVGGVPTAALLRVLALRELLHPVGHEHVEVADAGAVHELPVIGVVHVQPTAAAEAAEVDAAGGHAAGQQGHRFARVPGERAVAFRSAVLEGRRRGERAAVARVAVGINAL